MGPDSCWGRRILSGLNFEDFTNGVLNLNLSSNIQIIQTNFMPQKFGLYEDLTEEENLKLLPIYNQYLKIFIKIGLKELYSMILKIFLQKLIKEAKTRTGKCID